MCQATLKGTLIVLVVTDKEGVVAELYIVVYVPSLETANLSKCPI